MKAKKTITLVFTVFLMLLLCSCSLAVPDAGTEGNDRLIGAFITPEYLDLFDMEAYLNTHASSLAGGKDITVTGGAEYEKRLYAAIDKNGSKDPGDWKVSFPDVEGSCFFTPFWECEEGGDYWGHICDEEICDSHMDIKMSDTGEEERSLSGTIHILPGKADEDISYYTNPVYQTADGRIYVVSGQGFSTSGDSSEGVCITTKLDEQTTATENGKSVTDKSSVEISIAVMYKPVKITLLQMDGENKVVKKTEYNPAKLPEKLKAEPEVEYIIVETEKEDFSGERVDYREIYERNEEGNLLETFYAMENGMLSKQSTEVEWESTE